MEAKDGHSNSYVLFFVDLSLLEIPINNSASTEAEDGHYNIHIKS